MIKSIKIEGFQSHINTQIEFSEHLNIITGPTDSGKSAILRALKKVIRDLPAGNDFVNNKLHTCTITMAVDSVIILRSISKDKDGKTKINNYQVGEQPFDSFGRDIPLEVITALNMPVVDLGDFKIDLHFYDQFDGPFLIGDTSSVKSKVLGSVSGLNVIDEAIKKVNKDSRQINSDLKTIEKDVNQIQTELSILPDIEKLLENAERFENTLTSIENSTTRLDKLKTLYDQLMSIAQKGKALNNELQALPNLDSIDFEQVKQKITTLNQLSQFDLKLTRITSQITTLENDSVITFIPPTFELIKKKIITLKQLRESDNVLEKLNTTEITLERQISKLDEDIDVAKKNWEDTLIKLGVCPVCKQNTKEVHFE